MARLYIVFLIRVVVLSEPYFLVPSLWLALSGGRASCSGRAALSVFPA